MRILALALICTLVYSQSFTVTSNPVTVNGKSYCGVTTNINTGVAVDWSTLAAFVVLVNPDAGESTTVKDGDHAVGVRVTSSGGTYTATHTKWGKISISGDDVSFVVDSTLNSDFP